MTERRPPFWVEGDESPFDLRNIIIFIAPHLEKVLILDGRPNRDDNRAFLLDKEELFPKDLKEQIQQEFLDLMSKSGSNLESLIALPEQLRTIIMQKLSLSLAQHLPCHPAMNPQKNFGKLSIAVIECGSTENLWNSKKGEFMEKLAGKIDLLTDLRNSFELLILEERKQVIKGDGSSFKTLWQNPNLN